MKKLGTVGNVLRWLFGIIFLIGGLSIAGSLRFLFITILLETDLAQKKISKMDRGGCPHRTVCDGVGSRADHRRPGFFRAVCFCPHRFRR